MKFLPVLVAALVLAGCAKNIDNPEAVKQGIIKDIGKKVDVQNMDVSVDSVSFRDKEATANVSFRPKGGDPSMSMTMTYNMVRQGDEWHVKARDMMRHEQAKPADAGAAPNSGAMPGQTGEKLPPVTPGTPLPPGHPPMGSGAMGSGAGTTGTRIPMPMPIPAGSGSQLPAGHPPLNPGQ